MNTREKIATLIIEALSDEGAHGSFNYINSDIATGVILDGEFDIKAVSDAVLKRFEVVELPKAPDEDDDGQVYFDDGDIRVDRSGSFGTTIYYKYNQIVTPDWLRRAAAEFLAAAKYAEEGK